MADSKDLKDFGKELGVANDKLESFASSIKKLIRDEIDGFKKVNSQLSIGKDLVEELAKSYDDIKDVIESIDLSRTISQEKDLLGEIMKKKKAENAILDSLNEYKSISDQIQNSINKQTDMVPDLEYYDLLKKKQIIESTLKNLIASYDALLKQNRALENQKRLIQDIKITIENTFGFNQFKGLFGILAKLPNLENAFKNLSISTMILLGVMTMYLKAIFTTLYKAFDDINGAFVKSAKSFGLLKDEAGILKSYIYDTTIELSKYGVTAEEVAATATHMVDSFGSLTLFNAKAAKDLTLISKQLGVGNKELVDGVMTLMSFGKIDMVKATKVVYFASALSKAAGVPLAKVMDDVAKAGDKARGMIKGGAEQLVKSAVYARRLGTDLEKVAEIGRKMLDFQESITDEIEASVVLGSNISFQKARELFYTGKIQEGYDEIFKVVKNIGDFNKLDIFQKELIAKATGLSLTDLQKQLQIREDLAAVEMNGTEKGKKLVQQYKQLKEQSGGILENTAAAQEQRVKDLVNLKETEEITARIKGLFLSISSWILPGIEKTLSAINWILNELDSTGGKIVIGFVTLGLTIYSIIKSVQIFKALFTDLRLIMNLIKNASVAATAQTVLATEAQVAQAAAVQATAAAELELATARRASGLSGLAGLTGGLAAAEIYALGGAILAIAGAFVLLSYGLKQFNDIKIEDVGLGLLALAGLIGLTSLAIAAMSEVIVPAAGVIGLFAGAIILLSGAVIGVGYGMKLFGDGLKNVGEGLKIAVNALKDFGQNVSIIDSVKLAGVFAAINSSIRDFDLSRLQSIVSAMQSLATSLNSISTFKGIPQLTLPTNAVNTTNVPTVLTNTPVISPVQTNVQTTNTPTTNSTTMIDAVKQGIKEGMNNISLNVYLDGQKMVTGLSKNVGFRQDTGGIAMQSSLT
jgi:hypothetical protein